MPSCATSAAYVNTLPPNNRRRVRISGRGLKVGCTTADVQSKAQDANGNETSVENATNIIDSAGTQCEAVLRHGANFDKTFVRIRCADGAFSDWVEVQK